MSDSVTILFLLFEVAIVGATVAFVSIAARIRKGNKKRAAKAVHPAPISSDATRPSIPMVPQVAALTEAARTEIKLNLLAQQAYDNMHKASRDYLPL